jgi:Na+-translocating ferredoxin:NAD+ oxidoreductase RNF subunit RnfB
VLYYRVEQMWLIIGFIVLAILGIIIGVIVSYAQKNQ